MVWENRPTTLAPPPSQSAYSTTLKMQRKCRGLPRNTDCVRPIAPVIGSMYKRENVQYCMEYNREKHYALEVLKQDVEKGKTNTSKFSEHVWKEEHKIHCNKVGNVGRETNGTKEKNHTFGFHNCKCYQINEVVRRSPGFG